MKNQIKFAEQIFIFQNLKCKLWKSKTDVSNASIFYSKNRFYKASIAKKTSLPAIPLFDVRDHKSLNFENLNIEIFYSNKASPEKFKQKNADWCGFS